MILGLFILITSTTIIAKPWTETVEYSRNGKRLAEITKFHVNTKIQMRYAITNIETDVKNHHDDIKEVFFNMYIPKEAFVANFSMVIKDKTYVAKVDTKEKAKKVFEKSTTTSGLVQSFTDPKFLDGKFVSKTSDHIP